jgi:hypothetical protein
VKPGLLSPKARETKIPDAEIATQHIAKMLE